MGAGGIERQLITCPLCGQASDEAVLPVVFGENGVPLEMATTPGWGVPVVGTPPYLSVQIDGAEVEDAVAYSIPQGWVWKAQRAPDGEIVIRQDAIVYERVSGVVTVEVFAR